MIAIPAPDVHSLQVVNIYDIDARTYEFKLALPVDVSSAASAVVSASTSLGNDPTTGAGAATEATSSEPGTTKLNLIMESGARFHASRFTRPHASDAGNLPSGFTMKLRKHVRSRRLSGSCGLRLDAFALLTWCSLRRVANPF